MEQSYLGLIYSEITGGDCGVGEYGSEAYLETTPAARI